jgi:HKD family nuclease
VDKNTPMEVSLTTEGAAKKLLLDLVASCDHVDIAVAWAGKNDIVDALVKNKEKLRHVVVGTHMYQTPPAVLRQLMPLPRTRYMAPDGELFHPKVYLFETGTRIAAIVGSHNLTRSAFDGPNLEASVALEGDATAPALRDLALFVRKAWDKAAPIKEDFLFAYEKQYEVNRSKRKDLRTFHALAKPSGGAAKPSPLSITWAEFERKVLADKYHSVDDRIAVLEEAGHLFSANPKYAAMTKDERKAIAGTYGAKETGVKGLPWGWFGTMFGQGDFKALVNNAPAKLSDALDEIPLDGTVDEAAYDKFVKLFREAFSKKSHVGGVATASRLLAMKRPDIFVAVNDANRRGLCDAFGVAYSTLSLDNYWERIVIPCQLSPWWIEKRPRRRQAGRIWDNRAALLDCIYYDPSVKKSAKKK